MNSSQFDLATLALKGKRYEEAENIYLNIATQDNSSEAWAGLAFCKLYQIANGRTMEEVSFCLNKAIQINPSVKTEVENKLIGNCIVILHTFINSYDSAIAKERALKTNAAKGALIAGISIFTGLNSHSAFGALASFAGASAGVGVAVDSFSKIEKVSEFKTILLSLCNQINNEIRNFVNPENPTIDKYNLVLSNLINCIEIKSKLNIHVSNEDLVRWSFLANNISTISFSNFKQNESYKKELSDIRAKYGIDALEGGKINLELTKTPIH
jgi:hypothetical protein